ncbi:MAG: bifunctional diaminohydroxyphosphoribosylaminopyrimidine deaminase/5-amino-6-(5-phosphoribosylamino)uracil reductase RibD [Bacteroidales bacterium]|nr:bifunctional diaminohydroxyphosphoribosylaminopyrimidine deaminase/5-amino-6-(5-phosphoribosylamino)uracil reductase RibD [Bacteroidales bacterium]
MTPTDEFYMRRCLRLAACGRGHTRPNPLVGSVVVKAGRIVSEGYHRCYGQYHAERNALLLASAADCLDATLYVNLEPCSHYGHTPPCANLIVERGIRRVVCACDDPNPLVSGRGFSLLERAGIEVERHVLEADGRRLNRRFFTMMEQRRPYVILKWAESSDGFIAPADNRPYWLTLPWQDRLNHRWRTEEAAIVVGSETYLRDHPQLTPRHVCGPAPQPVVIDRRSRLTDVPSHWLHLHTATPEATLQELFQRGLQSVIIEGGRLLLDAFLQADLYDEVRLLRSPRPLGSGLSAPDRRSIDPRRLTVYDWQLQPLAAHPATEPPTPLHTHV